MLSSSQPRDSAISLSATEHIPVPTINPSLPRCNHCDKDKIGRNLVVCIDGTSNKFGHNNTNVVKLFAKVNQETNNLEHPKQYAYYSSGIGTGTASTDINKRVDKVISDKFDMAVAWNIKEIVKDAYGWLARMYQEGDQIYLFGFSRGAYQVRVLAGMIHEVGLLRTPTEKQIGTAYVRYKAIRSAKAKTRQIVREFKNTFSWKDLKVHFIGVWDTVSSEGLIKGDVFLSTSSSAAHACHFRHALALDELRVKFMPEYFHEMNSPTDDGKFTRIKHAPNPTREPRKRTTRANGTEHPEEQKTKTAHLKEVWFAGSHSDVGGKNKPGNSYQAGNASLLWMRREATASGLMLDPTDIVWVPDDIDFGTSNSMSRLWRFIEWIPIKHQVSFSGSGENDRRRHLYQPRRIIPGQKVHGSILYANAYKPRATLGEGFDISILHGGPGTEPDDDIWETGFFDDTTARVLVGYLGGQQGVAPIYLDRLLFMLRFKEGKNCVRAVPDWQGQFKRLINNSNCASLVRLVALVAYYEASCDPEASEGTVPLAGELPQNVFDDAEQSLSSILSSSSHKHRNGPRVVALLRPLTNHQILQEKILTPKVLKKLVTLLDNIIAEKDGNFGQAMDGLNCLLDCKHTQKTIVDKLGKNYPPESNVSRLSRILEINDPPLLTAALRMVMALARIQEGKRVCSNLKVKARLRELAKKNEQLIGLLSVEILFVLYDPNDTEQLDIQDAHVRSNLAGALTHLNPGGGQTGHDSADPAQQVLRKIFGLGADTLDATQKKHIGALKRAVQKGKARERTAATLTLLNLCKTDIIRAHLLSNELLVLDVFVNQLRSKDTALLAAYALTTCMKNYGNMMVSMMSKEDLPKNIVHMLQHDYFDDAVGQVEGFQIFGDFMQHADLREKIEKYNISEILSTKLGKGRSKETRTSLICLDIFRSFDGESPWTGKLVDQSLDSLREPEWEAQKVGVTMLSALAQTKHGVAVIKDGIPNIIEMLLPEGYLPIQLSPLNLSASNQGQTEPAVTDFEPAVPSPLVDTPSSPSQMMGPACALRVLAQNKELRKRMRETIQYSTLKDLFETNTEILVEKTDTPRWRVWTPNRADIIDMLDKMFKAVDEEMSEDSLMSIGDSVLPHIQHWDLLLKTLRDGAQGAVAILALLGVSVLAVVPAVAFLPFYLPIVAFTFLRSKYRDRLMDRRIQTNPSRSERKTNPGSGTIGPSGHGGESSQVTGVVEGTSSTTRL